VRLGLSWRGVYALCCKYTVCYIALFYLNK
jgi:hypothetical protein